MYRVGLFRIEVRKAVHFVDQHRVALLGDKQALAYRIVSQAFEPLVAAHVHTEGHLFRVRGVEKAGVMLQMDLDQALLALVRDHVGVGADELDSFRITKTDQRDAPQDPAVERQLDQFGVLIGDREQAFAHRVVGQG
ncbi:hypothetical protein D3C76_1180600 [compost metagenome]